MNVKVKKRMICKECAVVNGGELRDQKGFIDIYLGKCEVCTGTEVISRITYWRGLKEDQEFILPLSKKKREKSKKLLNQVIVKDAHKPLELEKDG